MNYYKLAIFGEIGSGKTSLIKTLSEISPFDTEVESTIDINKKYTTVGVEYGRISLDSETALGLYGVPGQERYKFLWEMVSTSLWGVILLFKYGKEINEENVHLLLNHFYPDRTDAPCIIGLTHCESNTNEEVATVSAQLQKIVMTHNIQAPIMRLNPTNREAALSSLNILNTINSY